MGFVATRAAENIDPRYLQTAQSSNDDSDRLMPAMRFDPMNPHSPDDMPIFATGTAI